MPWSRANKDAAAERRERARSLKEQGYSVQAIASKLGVSAFTAQEYCRGVKRRAPRAPVQLPDDYEQPESPYFALPNERFPAGRSCLICKTRLSRYNESRWCWLHAGVDESALIARGDPADFERLFYWIANERLPHFRSDVIRAFG